MTLNKVFSAEPWAGRRERMESRKGNAAPLLGTGPCLTRPEPFGFCRAPMGPGEGRFAMPDFVTTLLSEHFDPCLFYSLAFSQLSLERAWRQKKKKKRIMKEKNQKEIVWWNNPKVNLHPFVVPPKLSSFRHGMRVNVKIGDRFIFC